MQGMVAPQRHADVSGGGMHPVITADVRKWLRHGQHVNRRKSRRIEENHTETWSMLSCLSDTGYQFPEITETFPTSGNLVTLGSWVNKVLNDN